MRTKFSFLIVLIVFLLPGCSGSSSTPVVEVATVTQKPTMTITPTPTHPPTSTATPIPTLTTEERVVQVKEWLATNADCRLPCWWGIEPGQVTWDQVSESLRPIITQSAVYEEDGWILREVPGFDLDREFVYNRVAFVEHDAMIIAILIRAFGIYELPNFKNVWASFSPEKIITDYGMPTRVWVKSRSSVHEGSPGPTEPYSVWLFYDDFGFLVRYIGLTDYRSVYKMCPVFGEEGDLLDEIYIYLQSPDANIPLEQLPTVINTTNGAISLEEAAGISLSDFYNLFTKPGVEPCFETPRDIWP